MSSSRPWCALIGLSALVLLGGCGQPVREDRTIHWSPEGNAVGFQHGREGVFVADKNGGGLTKIFQPTDDVLATSPPLWSPDGRQLIFTTAQAENGPTPPPMFGLGREQDPNGNVHLQQPIRYTCWLRDREGDVQPRRLFDAVCDHVGYVAAGLAVRWHPDGDKVLFINRTEPQQHGIFEHDVNLKTRRRFVPLSAEAILFDWAPDHKNLVCLLASVTKPGTTDGIWVGVPGEANWWRVAESEWFAVAELPSVLELLRASRPAWTPDGRRFAFVTCRPARSPKDPAVWRLHHATLATREVRVRVEGPEPFRDLYWAPDGVRLGLVRGGPAPTLHILDADGQLSPARNLHPVRRFAGWSRGGDHLAYVGPGVIPTAEEAHWALLLQPNPEARDAVFLAKGADGADEREVFSGMRTTFPLWSPQDEKLSVWFTFSPAYRSWFSSLLASYFLLGVRPGDPAATVDAGNGSIGWMAVNADEKRQVGHYYLMKREYAEAWKWYEEANREAGNVKPPRPETLRDYFEQVGAPHDNRVFESICLTHLGRADEARQRLAAFRNDLPPLPEKDPLLDVQVGNERVRDFLPEITDPKSLLGTLLRDLYIAEVFLSMDAVEDGERFFADALLAPQGNGSRLSKALLLSQFLLLSKKHGAYADLAVDEIIPLLRKLHQPNPPQQPQGVTALLAMLREQALRFGGGAALVPLTAPDFLAELPEEKVRRVYDAGKQLYSLASPDDRRMIDLGLWAAADRLGLDAERRAIEARQPPDAPIRKDQMVQRSREVRQALREAVRLR